MSEANASVCLISYGNELTQLDIRRKVQVTKTKRLLASHNLDREKCQRTEQKVFHQTKLEVFSLVRNHRVSDLSAIPIF